MNREELVDAVARDTGLTKAMARNALVAVLENIQKAVAGGEKVSLPGFGAFEAIKTAEREGRNPQTGAPVKIPARSRPKFTVGKGFKDAVAR